MHSPVLKSKPLKVTDYKIKHTIPVQIRKHKLSGQWKRPGSNPLLGRKIFFPLSFQIPSKEPFTTNYSVAQRRKKSHCILLRVILRLEFHTTAKHTPATKQYTQQGCCEVTSFLLVWPDRKWARDVKRLTIQRYTHTRSDCVFVTCLQL